MRSNYDFTVESVRSTIMNINTKKTNSDQASAEKMRRLLSYTDSYNLIVSFSIENTFGLTFLKHKQQLNIITVTTPLDSQPNGNFHNDSSTKLFVRPIGMIVIFINSRYKHLCSST